MTAAALLTVLALLGVFIGCVLGQSKAISVHLAAAGGGLLFGIAIFWLIPEIAQTTSWMFAVGCALGAGAVLLSLDGWLHHVGHSPRHGFLGPLMIATSVHSFLDGWSVRAVGTTTLASAAVIVGLALHKIPEGLALGWIIRRRTNSAARAVLLGSAVECATLLGGFAEPRAVASGQAAFGVRWSAGILAVVSGSFLFLAFHTLWPERTKAGVVPVFAVAVAAAGATAFFAGGG